MLSVVYLMLFMLSVANKLIMLRVIMLIVVMLIVIMLNDVAPKKIEGSSSISIP
jgi:hypothetical protein